MAAVSARTALLAGAAAALEPFWFRGKGRVLRAFCPREGQVRREIFGVPMSLDLGDWMQRSIFLGVYEPEETKWLQEYLRPGMVVVDVGANVGYYTLLARSAVGPTGRVIAVEPSPVPATTLAAAAASFENVTMIRAALGAESGDGALYLDETARNHTPTLVAHAGASKHFVAIRTLDDCLSECGVERVDLLKLDVEGWEPQVLAGAGRLLAERRIRAVLCEFNSYWLQQAGSSPSRLRQSLTAAGFKDARSGQGVPRSDEGTENRFFVIDEPARDEVRGS